MHEYILARVVSVDETITVFNIKPFDMTQHTFGDYNDRKYKLVYSIPLSTRNVK